VVAASFVTADVVIIKALGFGIALAVLIDATIVRALLVPATMRLLGDWNWYLPKWLEWLPDLRIEGSPEPPTKPAPVGPTGSTGGAAPVAGD
jgi:RND superfamily putative drug exporter